MDYQYGINARQEYTYEDFDELNAVSDFDKIKEHPLKKGTNFLFCRGCRKAGKFSQRDAATFSGTANHTLRSE
ncbi:hypothetical protein POVCU2_0031120 [Plasmodium ovale curtisi]|uniref:Uncharacterized protein n=1 Tax=Plasmodium ovale curtisi TaxID=864141 RepID=A0A1A8WP16_PLAOA|nr:hypothetical protein POVCU2_0031120 [Plasmodium ovale curtisi]SBS94628.1 hypothetical protein POVCU1_028690 [Plasmodium ovale curtisi]